MNKFDAKDPAEIVPLSFEFVALTNSPGNPAISIVRHSGAADASPASMLAGSPQLIGTQVRQKVTGGVAGATYAIKAQVDAPDGSRYVLAGLLPVESA